LLNRRAPKKPKKTCKKTSEQSAAEEYNLQWLIMDAVEMGVRKWTSSLLIVTLKAGLNSLQLNEKPKDRAGDRIAMVGVCYA
jgi:hypothetical protein